MTSDKKKMNIPGTTLADLLGHQSVRATFRISEKAVAAVSIVAGHLGIKQKSLFDHLIEDRSSLLEIAKNLPSIRFKETPRVQKTFVLSRKTLDSLESISKNFGTPRDVLVEYSIRRLEEIIEAERGKNKLREDIGNEYEKILGALKNLTEKSVRLLSENDKTTALLAKEYFSAENTLNEINAIIEKGKLIEDF